MSTEPEKENDAKRVSHAGILNWPSALMLALWLLVILGFSGIESFMLLSSPIVLGIILIAAVIVTLWTALRFIKGTGKKS